MACGAVHAARERHNAENASVPLARLHHLPQRTAVTVSASASTAAGAVTERDMAMVARPLFVLPGTGAPLRARWRCMVSVRCCSRA